MTGSVGGSVASVTAAVTLPSIPSNWITAAGIAASALNGKGDWALATTALSNAQWTNARAGYLDNLSAGAVALESELLIVNTNVLAIPTDPLTSLGTTAPAGWINTAAFASGATLPIVTTATNLTNAPTAGDFTAAMKASLNAATPASVVGAVGSVAGNLGGNVSGNVAGSVGSVAVGGITSSSFASGAITDAAIAVPASPPAGRPPSSG